MNQSSNPADAPRQTYAVLHSLCPADGPLPEFVFVEAVLRRGLPGFSVTGLSANRARQCADRLRAAIRSIGIAFPYASLMVNVAPADVPRRGTGLDLSIAAAVLRVMGRGSGGTLLGDLDPRATLYLGELGLSGRLLEPELLYPYLTRAPRLGFRTLVTAPEAARAARALPTGLRILGIESLGDLLIPPPGGPPQDDLMGSPVPERSDDLDPHPGPRHLRLAPAVKRAMFIAAAGGHSSLLIGPPGTGKTSLARALHGLLPAPDPSELLDLLAAADLFGGRPSDPRAIRRPFRAPHHSATTRALIGGGVPPGPGEATRAHGGVLFLDELGEYSRATLQALREPLEDGVVRLSRGGRSVELPARFLFVAAANPCPCGQFMNPSGKCRCSAGSIHSYLGRLYGPLSDRIDMEIAVGAPEAGASARSSDSSGSSEFTGGVVAESFSGRALARAREAQKERYRDESYRLNGEVPAEHLDRYSPLPRAERDLGEFLESVLLEAGGSYRALAGFRRLARTIADLSGAAEVRLKHLEEAASYRCLARYRASVR